MEAVLSHIVVIDDDNEMRSLLEEFLSGLGYKVSAFSLATEALEFLKERVESPDLILSDINMPKMSGLDLIKEMKEQRPEVPVILMTAFGSIESAVEAIRVGAYDYITKPFKLTEIQIILTRALEYSRIRQENKILRREVKKSWSFEGVIGKSASMQSVFDMIQRVSGALSNILINGESGTGKEVVARAIHNMGPRCKKPFVAINCTAIPETLLESELFGYVKGAFTGANHKKIGLFEEAHGGTIFLDEIGDMPLEMQAKLLRVLQERKIRAVGDTVMKDIDVRVIAATHKDLKAAIKEGCFREDLYYRLGVIPIQIPPLRHRKEDIPLLAEHFLQKFVVENGSKVQGFTPEAMNYLIHQRWEGNVRELENLVERAVVLASGSLITREDFPQGETGSIEDFYGKAFSNSPTLSQLEEKYIRFILDKTGRQKGRASQILGINRRTLYRKEHEYGLSTTPIGNA